MTDAKNKLIKIEKRKKLSALFESGNYAYFSPHGKSVSEDSGGWEMRVWINAPNPLQRDQAMREGQAARAKVILNAREDSNSSDWLSIRSFIVGLKFPELIEYILNAEEIDRLNEARRDVLIEDEWDDFNSLREAMEQYEKAGSPVGDPEWTSLLDRELEFAKQVTDRAAEIRQTNSEAMKLIGRKDLEKKALDIRIESAGSAAFIKTYEDWMMFFSVRDDEEHDEQLFDDLDDFKSMPQVFQSEVAKILGNYINEGSEAKN